MKYYALAGAGLSVLTGCAQLLRAPGLGQSETSSGVTVVVSHHLLKLPKLCSKGVALLTPSDAIAPDSREVAHLEASGDWDDVSNTKLYREMARDAARLGANAIVVENLGEATTLGKLVELRTGWVPQRHSSARAIYLPADTQRVRLACHAKT